jgi:hypothetical protein
MALRRIGFPAPRIALSDQLRRPRAVALPQPSRSSGSVIEGARCTLGGAVFVTDLRDGEAHQPLF